MWLMFWCTFELGSYPMGSDRESGKLDIRTDRTSHDRRPLKDLLLDGVIGGVGGVIVFLPNILILYAFISFMEDSGYMARVAFIMDKLMHKMGLHGKSFIPLVMGFRLQRAGHNVDTHNRKQVKPTYNDSDQPLHQLFGAYTDLCPACGSLLPRARSIGVFVGLLSFGSHCRCGDSPECYANSGSRPTRLPL